MGRTDCFFSEECHDKFLQSHLRSHAPDIIEAILRGDEPDGLSLEKLRKDLPVRWDEQKMAW